MGFLIRITAVSVCVLRHKSVCVCTFIKEFVQFLNISPD